jgi:hypothetical protein
MQKGAIELTGYITPTSESDTYPTHLDIYGKGGYRSIDTLESRDAITADRRTEGMLVYVNATNRIYQLVGGITNDDWKDFASLPPLGTFTIAGVTYPEIYVGTESGVPETSQSFGYALVDLAALNFRFLTGDFIMGSAPVQATYPGAQFIVNLPDGLLAKTGSTLRGAESGADFVDINRQLCYEYAIPVWLTDNNKTLTSSRLRVIDGDPDDGDDLRGIRNLNMEGALIARAAVTSDDSVFGLNNIGTREVKVYDRDNVGAGRLTKSVNFIAAYSLASNVNFYLPETESSLGKVLADVGETVYDGRIFRKLDFVDIASNAATYILQTANESLPNSQALDVLGSGILKNGSNGVLSVAVGGSDYVTPTQLEEEAATRAEVDGALETSITALTSDMQAQIAAITGYGTLALLTEFLANLGWTSGYSEYLWSKYRPLRTYNTYGDTDNYSKDGGNIWYDANHIGSVGAFKPGLRITSWDSSNFFASDLFPVSMGLFGYRRELGVVSVQDGFVWQSYFENNSSSPHYRFPVNFGLYHVGHDENSIGWNRQERLLMEYRYYEDRFTFEKKTEFKQIVRFSGSAIGMSIGNTSSRPTGADLYPGLMRINTDIITPSPDPTDFIDVLGTPNQIKVVQDVHNFTISFENNVKLPGTAYTKIAVGNNSQRPDISITEPGMIRFNSDL